MKLNQKGFGVIEGLLVVIALTLIVGVGFYVVNANKDDEKSTKESNQSSTKAAVKPVDPTDDWLTFSDKDPANSNYAGTPSGGDGKPLSFKYPSNWKTYAINSDVTLDGKTTQIGANTLVPNEKVKGETNTYSITFASNETGYENLTAEQYFKKLQSDSPSNTGPDWQSIESYTTKNGYSAHSSKLVVDGMTRYNIDIVNGKNVATFGYDDHDEQYASTIKQIIDTLKFL